MKLHHTAHHQGYTDKLNLGLEALRGSQPELAALPLEKLLQVRGPRATGADANAGRVLQYHSHSSCWSTTDAPLPILLTGSIQLRVHKLFISRMCARTPV